MSMPLFRALVVYVICGDPVGRKSLLRGGNVDLSITNHAAHPSLQSILSLCVPCLFYASSWLRPEIGWVIRATKAKRNKMIDLVIGVRTGWYSVSPQDFVSPHCVHPAPALFGVATCCIAVYCPY